MQFHYVVGYDSETGKWFVEADPEAYFPDGSVWDERDADDNGYGWFMTEDGTPENALDMTCWQMLNSLVSIWPSPVVNGEL
jgi:hypothetical protein